MSKIPGFRSGKAWKKVVSTTVYIVIIIVIVFVVSFLRARKNANSAINSTPALVPVSNPVSTAASTANTSQEAKPTTSADLTIQAIARQNGSSIGELNKIYRLDSAYKYANGSYMIVNFENVKATRQISNFNNVILIEIALPFHKTRQILGTAGFISLYDTKGKQVSDLKFNETEMDNQDTGIIVYSEKEDLTKYKYLSFGPIDGANGQQLLFPIQ